MWFEVAREGADVACVGPETWLAPRGQAPLVYGVVMDEQQIDIDSLRERFPWVGLASIDEPELSVRYREILAARGGLARPTA